MRDLDRIVSDLAQVRQQREILNKFTASTRDLPLFVEMERSARLFDSLLWPKPTKWVRVRFSPPEEAAAPRRSIGFKFRREGASTA